MGIQYEDIFRNSDLESHAVNIADLNPIPRQEDVYESPFTGGISI